MSTGDGMKFVFVKFHKIPKNSDMKFFKFGEIY